MLVSWRGPACLAGTIPQPAHPIGYAVARPEGRAFLRARRWRPAPPSPAARFARSPLPPLAPSGPNRKTVSQSGGRGRSIGSRCALRACGRRNQRLCGLHCRALSWGAPAPMPPEAACGRVGAPLARIAPPNPAAPAIAQARRHAPRAARCQRRPLGLCLLARSCLQAAACGRFRGARHTRSGSVGRIGTSAMPRAAAGYILSWLLG